MVILHICCHIFLRAYKPQFLHINMRKYIHLEAMNAVYVAHSDVFIVVSWLLGTWIMVFRRGVGAIAPYSSAYVKHTKISES